MSFEDILPSEDLSKTCVVWSLIRRYLEFHLKTGSIPVSATADFPAILQALR